ncbi:unnamed protein product, partial [Allacma fusca]
MDKLTEFVTNSFIDREVSVLMTKSVPKSEPPSPLSGNSDSPSEELHFMKSRSQTRLKVKKHSIHHNN